MAYKKSPTVNYDVRRVKSAMNLKASPATRRLMGQRGFNVFQNRHRARIMRALSEAKDGGDVKVILEKFTPEQKFVMLYEVSRNRPLTEAEVEQYRECYKLVTGREMPVVSRVPRKK
jgi:hypothetical protein